MGAGHTGGAGGEGSLTPGRRLRRVPASVRAARDEPSLQAVWSSLSCQAQARGRAPRCAQRQQINSPSNSVCNTQNTCLLSFHLLGLDAPSLPSIMLQSGKNIISEMLII